MSLIAVLVGSREKNTVIQARAEEPVLENAGQERSGSPRERAPEEAREDGGEDFGGRTSEVSECAGKRLEADGR